MQTIQSNFPPAHDTGVFPTLVKVFVRLMLVLALVLFSSGINPFHPAMIAHAIGVTVPVGHHPIGVVVDPIDDTVYVAANGDNAVNYFSGSAQAPFNVNYIFFPQNVGGPSAMAATQISVYPNKRLSVIYVINQFNNSISILPNGVFPQPTVSLGKQLAGVDVDSVTNLVYVANFQEGTVSVIPGADGTNVCSKCLTVTATIRVGPLPLGVAVNSMTHHIYVTSNFGNW